MDDWNTFISGASPSPMATESPKNDSGDSTTGLYSALGGILFLILVGFLLAKFRIFPTGTAKVLGIFVVKLALPALVFNSMATLSFKNVQWFLLLGICLAKIAVALLVVIVSIVLERGSASGLARAGIRGIFCTQSNDFALGLPILAALYPPSLTQYLYLFAPISFLIINPVMFLLMELGTRKMGKRGDGRSIGACKLGLQIFRGVLTNPVVIGTILGIVVNFATGTNVPSAVRDPLQILGNSFNALALVSLGINMVGKLGNLRGAALGQSLLLIVGKVVLLPVVAAVILSALGDREYTDPETNDNYKYNLFGFIYGTFPTAPSAYAFALDFGVDVDLISSAVVLGTLIAAPMMIVSAKMATISLGGESSGQYYDTVHSAGLAMGFISLVGAVVLFAGLISKQRLPGQRHRQAQATDATLMCLCSVVIIFAVATGSCNINASNPATVFRFAVNWWCLFALRIWLLFLALSRLAMMEPRFRRFCPPLWTQILCAMVVPAILVSCIWLIDSDIKCDAKFHCWFMAQHAPFDINMGMLVTVILAMLCSIITASRSLRTMGSRQNNNCQEVSPLLADGSSALSGAGVPRSHSASRKCDGDSTAEASGSGRGLSNGLETDTTDDTDDDDDPILDMDKPPALVPKVNTAARTAALATREPAVGPGQVQERSANLSDPESVGDGLSDTEAPDPSTSSVKSRSSDSCRCMVPAAYCRTSTGFIMFLLFSTASMLLDFFVSCFEALSHKDAETGVSIELIFLDYVFIYAHGFVMFLCFGLDTRLYEPITRYFSRLLSRFRQRLYGVETVDYSDAYAFDHQITGDVSRLAHALEQCKDCIVRTQMYHLRRYKAVFKGSDFVDWLVTEGFARDRTHAVRIGRNLVLARVLYHVTNEHHFHDAPFFYRFHPDAEALCREVALQTPSGSR